MSCGWLGQVVVKTGQLTFLLGVGNRMTKSTWLVGEEGDFESVAIAVLVQTSTQSSGNNNSQSTTP